MVVMDRVAWRDAALERANEVRSENARLKRRIAAMSSREGATRLADLIEQEPCAVAALRVQDALCSVRRLGEAKADSMRVCAGRRIMPVPSSIMIRNLTTRQREALVAELRLFASRHNVGRGD